MDEIRVERIGRRSYLRGATFPWKEEIRGAGGHWSADEGAWWIGDHDRATALAARFNANSRNAARFRKLEDGSWGVSGKGLDMKPGVEVTVRKASGETTEVTVERVISTAPDGFQIATVVRQEKPKAAGPWRPRGWSPCGYPGCSPRHCDECDGEGRYGSGSRH